VNAPKSTTTGLKKREDAILDLLKKGLERKCFDAILIPVKVPAGDSYVWVLAQDNTLLDDASPLPPVMPVQGAKAISSVMRRGKGRKMIAAVMRPCEISATIELSKLGQVELDNVFLISIDCPGVLPLSDYLEDAKKGGVAFEKVFKQWGNESVRPICRVCHRFSIPMEASDIHIGMLGAGEGDIFIIPNSPKGETILKELDISPKKDIDSWKDKVEEITKEREKKRENLQEELKPEVIGLDRLLDTFGKCINCHNCMRVCPVCYCRQCYFDSEKLKHPYEDYLLRAEMSGGLRFLPDTLLFHIGRMAHMSLSCVSCGSCEDACPLKIPVSQIFCLIADETQKLFDYIPGRKTDEPVPMATYKEEELKEVED